MPENERARDREPSNEAQRKDDEALRQDMAALHDDEKVTDDTPLAQPDNGAQPEPAAPDPAQTDAPGSTIDTGDINTDTFTANQAETINNTNARTVNNIFLGTTGKAFLEGFSLEGVDFAAFGTGKERFKPPERRPEDIELPVGEEKIKPWYLSLKANERCFVQAMSVFQGAPEDEVFYIAKLLFESFQSEKRARYKPQETANYEEYRSEDTLIEGVEQWTFSQHIKNADRLFWRDTDTDGVSIFGVAVIEVINYVARRSVGFSPEQDFMKYLERWSSRSDGEYSWRAARVLGTICWKENEARFRAKAEQWARSRWTSDWERAANFFYGAYLHEYEKQSERTDASALQSPDLSTSRRPAFPGKKRENWLGTAERQKREAEKVFQRTVKGSQHHSSKILALLEQWITQAHTNWRAGVGTGYAVAQAYRWIGQKSLQSALNGLQDLLEYPFNAQRDLVELPVLVFVTVVWSYVALANAGHTREILLYLAEQIKDLVFAQNDELSNEQWARRTISLDALFLVFFLLVRLSLSGEQHGTYSRSLKLDNSPALPDTQGRDTLLAAVLSHEEPEMRACLVQLFCAAIMEEQENSACELLEQWAEFALRKHEAETRKLGLAYREFLLDIGEEILEWCEAFEDDEDVVDLSGKLEVYREKLEEWVDRYSDQQPPSPLGTCAADVLEDLPF